MHSDHPGTVKSTTRAADDLVVTDALDRSLAPELPGDAPAAAAFAFNLPPVVPKRVVEPGSPPAAASPDDVLAAAAAAGWTVDPAVLAGGRRSPQRHGSWFGRLVGPLFLIGLVGSIGFGAWKLVQAATAETGAKDTDASVSSAVTDSAPGPLGAIGPAADASGAIAYPGTASVLPDFRSVTVEMTVEFGSPVGATSAHVSVELDVVDQVGRIEATTDTDPAPTTALFDSTHLYEPGDVFGAPWTRQPSPSAWFDDGAVVTGLDRLVAALGVAATPAVATADVLYGTPVTTYRSTVTLDGARLAALPGGDISPFAGMVLEGVHLTLSADANGVVRAVELDARDAFEAVLAAAPPTDLVSTFVRIEIVGWSDDSLGLSLPTNWVDG